MADFNGKAAVCIASGPSLNRADCALVEQSGLPSIAVNTSFEMAPFADVIYAGDAQWWDHHYATINAMKLTAELWSCSQSICDTHREINYFRVSQKNMGWNSGMRAIELAASFGAETILLLGYDVSIKHGVHWHGPHRSTKNPDSDRCRKWHEQFARTSAKLKQSGIKVINVSRYTELRCFPINRLEDELCLQHFPVDAHPNMNLNSHR